MSQNLQVIQIPVNDIVPSPHQPRIYFGLEELRGSIKQYGIRDPLKVRKVDDHYELIDGERRFRIAKQESMQTVPCLILKLTDEEADALAWRYNVDRKDYSLEERAKHFKKHQDEGMSAVGIGNIHGYSHQQVSLLLGIFQLPEKYQNYIWANEFPFASYQILYNKGLLNTDSFLYRTEITKLIDEAIDHNLKVKEFDGVVDKYTNEQNQKNLEEARNASIKAEVSKRREEQVTEAIGQPEVKSPETAEELERAAKILQEEAKRRKEEQQTPEDKAEIERKKIEAKEKRAEKEEEKRKQKQEKVLAEMEKIKEEAQHQVKEEAKQEAKNDLLTNLPFLQETSVKYSEQLAKESLHQTPHEQELADQDRKSRKYQTLIEEVYYKILGWGTPMVLAMGKEEWGKSKHYIEDINKWTSYLLQLDIDRSETIIPPQGMSLADPKRIVDAEYQVKED